MQVINATAAVASLRKFMFPSVYLSVVYTANIMPFFGKSKQRGVFPCFYPGLCRVLASAVGIAVYRSRQYAKPQFVHAYRVRLTP